MADAFISYSRKNAEFGRQLHTSLVAQNRDIWMDWKDIPHSAEWWEEITSGIDFADNFILLISPDSISSPICNLEVDYARRNNKRIIPVVIQETNEREAFVELITRDLNDFQHALVGDRDLLVIARDNWKELEGLNWIFFGAEDNFDLKVRELIDALDLDIDHVHEHTRLLNRSKDWIRRNRLISLLLRDDDLAQAETWLSNASERKLLPTPEHLEYIGASRSEQNSLELRAAAQERRTRNLRRASIIAALVGSLAVLAALGAAIVGLQAESRASIAGAAQLIAEANAADAGTQAGQAYQELTLIPPTVTQAIAAINAAGTQVSVSGNRLATSEAGASTAIFSQGQAEAEQAISLTQIADVQTQISNANIQRATSQAAAVTATVARGEAEVNLAVAQSDANAAGTEIALSGIQLATSEAGALTATVAQGRAEGTQVQALAQVNIASTRLADATQLIATSDAGVITATFAQGQAEISQATSLAQANAAATQAAGVENQLITATLAQGEALNQRETAVAGVQPALDRAATAENNIVAANATLTEIPITVTAFAENLSNLEATSVSLQSNLQAVADLSFSTVAQIYQLEYLLSQRDQEYCPNYSVALIAELAKQFNYCQEERRRNTLCTMQGTTTLTMRSGVVSNISQPGQSFDLTDIANLELSPATADDFLSLGIARLFAQANIPNVLPGQSVELYVIGSVSDVPPSILVNNQSETDDFCNQIIPSTTVQMPGEGLSLDFTNEGS